MKIKPEDINEVIDYLIDKIGMMTLMEKELRGKCWNKMVPAFLIEGIEHLIESRAIISKLNPVHKWDLSEKEKLHINYDCKRASYIFKDVTDVKCQ